MLSGFEMPAPFRFWIRHDEAFLRFSDVIKSGGQSSGFLIVILIFFLISPASDGIMIKNKIRI